MLRPTSGFNRQIALAASEIRDLDGRQQQAERARPRRPASAGNKLTTLVAVHRETVFSKAQHFGKPGVIAARFRGLTLELVAEPRVERRQRPVLPGQPI